VTCSVGVVTVITRDSKNLTGTIPSSLSALTSLQTLKLSVNQLTGSIPDLSALTSLLELWLHNNQLTGSIPDLSAWTSLLDLNLSNNKLTGSIPDLSALTSLQSLHLDFNQLTGSIPDLSALTSLLGLWLNGNQLTGSIPDLSALTSLRVLHLYLNQLTGSIPDLSALTSLQLLYLGINQLTGSIPDLSALTSLVFLHLGANQLTGSIPDLSGLTSLQQQLNLGSNQLTGSIPDLSALTSLQILHLGNNQLTGSIPDLSALTSLRDFYLQSNQLTGSIPDLSALTSLKSLYLRYNQLTGSIPDLSALTALLDLWLQNNQLSGIIPDLSGTALTLGKVDLSCNQFTGETGGSATARDPDWVSTQFCNAPAAPTGLTATPVSTTQLNLSWTDNSINETGFQIESPVGTLIHTTAANVTSYSHSGLTCNTTYTYSLTATNAFGNSAAITGNAMTSPCLIIPQPGPTPQPGPAWIADLTPYQETGLGVRVTIEGTGQGRVVSTTKGVGGQGIDCSSANQRTGCQANFVPATYVTLTPLPATDSAFSGWGGNEDCNKGTFLINGGVLCTAYFQSLNRPLTVEVNGRGKITTEQFKCPPTCQGNYLAGTMVTLQASPTPNWTFAGWSGDCNSQGMVTLTAAKTCRATFLDDLNIPNQGDGNGDGIKDAEQENVASLPDTVSGKYLTLAVDKGCTLDEMSTDSVEQLAGYNQKHQYPQGLVYFDIACAKTTVTLYLHGITKITRRFVLQKYGPKVPGDASTIGWYQIPDVTFDTVKVGNQSVMRASYTLVDGELGDNTGVDGHIIDPAGVMEVE